MNKNSNDKRLLILLHDSCALYEWEMICMEKVSRKEREYQIRREEILKAAEKIFAQNGFYNSTVAEIAKESEFAIGTLYQFFTNKEELYYTMMMRSLISFTKHFKTRCVTIAVVWTN